MRKARRPKELHSKQLRWACDESVFKCPTTNEVKPAETIVGQDRALKALELGLQLYAPGYNIFVSGLEGTGKVTTIKAILEDMKPVCAPAPDRCYVNNFQNPDRPRLLVLPRGEGSIFKREMENLLAYLQQHIPAVFEDEEYQGDRKRIESHYEDAYRKDLVAFEKKLKGQGFALSQVQIGGFMRPEIVPIVDGKPVPIQQVQELWAQDKFKEPELEQLKEKHRSFHQELEKILDRGRKIQREMLNELDELDQRTALLVIEGAVKDLKERYAGNTAIETYLYGVRSSLLQDIQLFREEPKAGEGSEREALSGAELSDSFLSYRANVVLDNSTREPCPVIIENAPTVSNLFGTNERIYDRGGWRTNFTKIKAGSLLLADGGYLVINALDVLSEPGVWSMLKRTLKTGQLEIPSGDLYMFASAMKPQPIDLNVKVVLIGNPRNYQLLSYYDEDFDQIFKILADFDREMDLKAKNLRYYASVVSKIIHNEDLRSFSCSALAAVAEYGVRRSGRRKKISTEFGEIADLVREANYFGRTKNEITREDVERAIEASIERHNLPEEKLQELIEDGTILIDTDGERIGQVNGLSVFQLGHYSFGRPSRITASTAMGGEGIINIEREAELSGETHNKGVLILSGYLRSKYAQDKPMSLSASLCFEQSYSSIDGDSASSTEIYALLSSLAGLPIRQGIAVTGSVNQKGDIQPIGGVNEKIEGFYRVCKARGLTGDQGVIIPWENVDNLMLRREIVEIVERGKFHIYPVRSIDEGIEILAGVRAGKRGKNGKYPKGTVNALVDAKLGELAEKMREFGAKAEEEERK